MEVSTRTAWIMVAAVFIYVIYGLFFTAKADTILEYTACSIHTCTTQKLYEDNSKFFECQVHGQRIVLIDLERKSKRHYYIRKWTCTLGKRYERL